MDTGYLNFCPRCGRQDLDREEHGSPGTALCRSCGTLFSVLSVRFGEKTVRVTGGGASTRVATGAGPVPEDPSVETTLPLAADGGGSDGEGVSERTLRIEKKPGRDPSG